MTSATGRRATAPTEAIELLREHSLATLAQQELERRILTGEIAAGSKLNEVDIATALGISRGPVREAFSALGQAGLVRQEKNRGVFVRDLPLDEALEIFEVRAMIDEAVGRRLATRATPEQVTLLRGMVERMEKSVKEGRVDDYHRLNLEFHDTLVEYAGNRKLTALYRRLIKELALLRRRNLADARLLPASASEHRAILKAIVAQDADAAGRALREHALDSMRRTARNHATTDVVPPGKTVHA